MRTARGPRGRGNVFVFANKKILRQRARARATRNEDTRPALLSSFQKRPDLELKQEGISKSEAVIFDVEYDVKSRLVFCQPA